MMTSLDEFAKCYMEKKYKELLSVRDDLLEEIKQFEDNIDQRKGNGNIHPSPEVRYQCNLEYLGVLCKLISGKYNREYVWGEDGE